MLIKQKFHCQRFQLVFLSQKKMWPNLPGMIKLDIPQTLHKTEAERQSSQLTNDRREKHFGVYWLQHSQQ